MPSSPGPVGADVNKVNGTSTLERSSRSRSPSSPPRRSSRSRSSRDRHRSSRRRSRSRSYSPPSSSRHHRRRSRSWSRSRSRSRSPPHHHRVSTYTLYSFDSYRLSFNQLLTHIHVCMYVCILIGKEFESYKRTSRRKSS